MPWRFYGTGGYKKPPVEITNSLAGEVVMFAGPQSGIAGSLAEAQSAPSGYLFCNGAVISKITNPEYGNLWSVLTKNGTVGLYGAFTANTATLPNFDDKFPVGAASGTNVGTSTNTPTHPHSIGDHTHNLLDHSHAIADSDAGGHYHNLNHSHQAYNHHHDAGTLYNNGLSASVPATNVGALHPFATLVSNSSHYHDYGGTSSNVISSDSPQHAPSAGVSLVTLDTVAGSSGITATAGTSGVTSGGMTAALNADPSSNVPLFRAMNFIIKV